MGCDIHIFAEVKNSQTNEWEKVGDIFKPYADYKTDQPYDGRDYQLFSILADVRNEGNITPIKECIGMPLDCSIEILEEYEKWDSDAHSATWYTLSELLIIKWPVIRMNKMVHESLINRHRQTGEVPNSWCSVTNMSTYKMYEWDMDFYSSFITYTIPQLSKLGNPENVRVIMWFDN